MSNDKRRQRRSRNLSRDTQRALAVACPVLARIVARPEVASCADLQLLVATLCQDVLTLVDAPARIGWARRLQGARVQRQSTALKLFAGCTAIRRRVTAHYRGSRHEALRHAFGEGLVARPNNPETVVALAERVLGAARSNPQVVKTVRVGPPTLPRLINLLTLLREGRTKTAHLLEQRRRGIEALDAAAARMQATCAALAGPLAAVHHGVRGPAPEEDAIDAGGHGGDL